MSIWAALGLFVVGLLVVLYFAGKLVDGAVGTARGFGMATFVVSVIFIGFDPENLAVGAVAAAEGVSGIALGSIIGAAMVTIALALGITALIVPLRFERTPTRVLALPVVAVFLFGALCLDGTLGRVDGALLLLAYAAAVVVIWYLGRRGERIEPAGGGKGEREAAPRSRWKALGLLVLSLAAIVGGSELLVTASKTIIEQLGISDTVYGMTILSLVISIEELARELPAARRGRPEISLGNVVGSVFAFFLMNAGIIAMVTPVPVSRVVLTFHLPAALVTTIAVVLLTARKEIPRWAGGLLVLLYVAFVAGSYLLAPGMAGTR